MKTLKLALVFPFASWLWLAAQAQTAPVLVNYQSRLANRDGSERTRAKPQRGGLFKGSVCPAMYFLFFSGAVAGLLRLIGWMADWLVAHGEKPNTAPLKNKKGMLGWGGVSINKSPRWGLGAMVILLAGVRLVGQAQIVPPLVNYQGRLSNPDGSPLATADYQLTFNIYDSATNASTNGLIWGPQIFDGPAALGHGPKIPVVQGYFNVMLGPVDTSGASLANAFNGTNRFVEITVSNRPPILPRQQILTAPFAFQAANAAKLAGYDWGAVFNTNDPSTGKILGSKLANGTVTAQQIASNTITAGQIGNNQVWLAGGNAGTSPGPNFVGTTDNTPLELRVNGQRALRVEPTSAAYAPNLIGGFVSNVIQNSSAAVIAGGGTSVASNGLNQIVNGSYSFVGGGFGNSISGATSNSSGWYSVVAGGRNNSATNTLSTIGGGDANTAGGAYSTIAGGLGNTTTGSQSAIAGGFANSVTASFAAVAGGAQNSIQEQYSFIGGGLQNAVQTSANESAIGGGERNTIQTNAHHSTISGGQQNSIGTGADKASISGGYANIINNNAELSVIGGGISNNIAGAFQTIGGGAFNAVAAGQYSTIAGGLGNYVTGGYAGVPSGLSNSVAGDYGFAAGRRAKAINQGAFVWADSTDADFPSTANNQFLIRAGGNVGINKNNPASALDVNGTVTATNFSGSAASLTGFNSGQVWLAGGNAGTSPGPNFVGTTDNQPLEMRVNGQRALRLEPIGSDVNAIGGASNNSVDTGGKGSTIGGGKSQRISSDYAAISGGIGGQIQAASSYSVIGGGYYNLIQTNADESTVGGGRNNTIQSGANDSTIAGGVNNVAGGYSSAIAGGNANLIQATSAYSAIGGGEMNAIGSASDHATIGGGNRNSIQQGAYQSTIAGGYGNDVQSNAFNSVIAGGQNNTLQNGASYSAIGGGYGNMVQSGSGDSAVAGGRANTIQTGASQSAIAGGLQNTIRTNASRSAIVGGYNNAVQSTYSAIVGGNGNTIQTNAGESFIGGGRDNIIQGGDGVISGGLANTASGSYDAIGGGYGNIATGPYGTIAGGYFNTNQSGYGFIGSGYLNRANGNASTVAGGWANYADGSYATVPGGFSNSVSGSYAFAAGRRAKANNQGTFVWGDSTDADFASTASDQFLIRAGGNVGINKNNPATALDVNGTVTATTFSGSGSGLTALNGTNLLNGSVQAQQIAPNTVALTNLAQRQSSTSAGVGGIAISSVVTTQITSAASSPGNPVSGLSVSLSVAGNRPVMVLLTSASTDPNNGSAIDFEKSGTAVQGGVIFLRNGSAVSSHQFLLEGANGALALRVPPGACQFIDIPISPGTYTYSVNLFNYGSASTMGVNYVQLVAFEF